MIRKLVGSMVAVAKNRLSLKTLENMMLCPPDYYGDGPNIQILNPNGLLLKRVYYNETDLDYTEKAYELYLQEKLKNMKVILE
jgi:tRNA U38,U39,U40 pseudouridine synthase TruA